MSRVVVVAIVVFAFAAASLPAYAAPFAEGNAAAKAESGWFEAAVAWMSQVIFGDQPVRPSTSSLKLTPMTGSCIDPLGRCGG
jgi:hypothetical protein